MGICRPFVLYEVLRLVQGARGHFPIHNSVAGEFIRGMLHAQYHTVSAEIVTGQREAWLEYLALINLFAFIDTLVPFEAVVEIVVYAKVYGKPIFYIIFRLNASHEIATLRESHILYQVV